MDEKLKTHFLNLYHMALTDTKIDTRELEMLYNIGNEKGISRSDINSILLQPDSIIYTVPESVYEKIENLFDFARIAWADGIIDENEKKLLSTFSKLFGFEEENIPTIMEFLLDEAKKGTSNEDIKKLVSETF